MPLRYPAPAVLEELGRITVYGSGVGVQLALLVRHLDPRGTRSLRSYA